ncbi:MAG: hypothetical protein DRN29_01230 [Thermoplasmata archaeon]|nr:MAG: hypothetical protein DRN29_01230 [Thermoplasmata archaeon]
MNSIGADIDFPVFNNTIKYNRMDGNKRKNSIAIVRLGTVYNHHILRNDILRTDEEWEEVYEKVLVEIRFSPLKVKVSKNYYNGNYWDRWHYKLPKPIDAEWIIRMFGRDILKFNGYIFDWHPSLQPNCS